MAKKKRQSKPQLAAQLYTLRDFCKNAKDFEKTMKRVRKIGYRMAQISGIGKIDPQDVRAIMDDANVQPIGAHIGLDEFKGNKIKNVIETCKTYGIKYVAIPWMSPDAVKTAAGWKQMARRFDKYGQKLQSEGITLQYHNHSFEFQKYGGKKGIGGDTGLKILYDNADKKNLQAELDVAWVARGGGDPAEWVKMMRGRMHQVHLKDWAMLNNEPIWTEVGEGNLNMDAVLKACKYAGVKHYIVEQDNCPITNDPFKSLEISYKNLKKMGLK